MPNPPPSLNQASLTGVRVWVSGSLPETEISIEKERSDILEFVSRFSAKVFQLGGHIIHGSDPSFTPTLLEQARTHQAHGGKKDLDDLPNATAILCKSHSKRRFPAWQFGMCVTGA